MMTYDREIIKMNKSLLTNFAQTIKSIEPGTMKFVPLLHSSQNSGQMWKYTFTEPESNWEKLEYDDKKWMIGKGGFGDRKSNNPVVRTEWAAEEIWLRKDFYINDINDLDFYLNYFKERGAEWAGEEIVFRRKNYNKLVKDLEIYVKYFNQFEQSTNIYLNGEIIRTSDEGFYSYKYEKISDQTKSLFRNGKNVIAVNCSQNMKQSYFDLGIYILDEDK
jgi:hypothetical protein